MVETLEESVFRREVRGRGGARPRRHHVGPHPAKSPRTIAREGEPTKAEHRKVFEARANLIWSVTTPQARKGHFAMGVELEVGLTIDAMADQLGALVDRPDAASLPGDVDELSNALADLAERLLVMRPFIPDKRDALPGDWRRILRQ